MADDPVEPFDATVAGVTALVPEATVVDTVVPGQRAVTHDQVTSWVAALSANVDARLAARGRLPGDDPRSVAVVAAARDLVHNGAASYLEAARHPERASKTDSSYAEVLWQRYTGGLAALGAALDGWLDDGAGLAPAPSQLVHAAWCMPAPRLPDYVRW